MKEDFESKLIMASTIIIISMFMIVLSILTKI